MFERFLAITEKPDDYLSQAQFDLINFRYHFVSGFAAGKKVLEIGCGFGFGLGFLKESSRGMVGGDITRKGLEFARRHYQGKIPLVQLDAQCLPFRDSSFDVISAMALVMYVDIAVFLKECRRILRKKGILIFDMANKDHPAFSKPLLTRDYYSAAEIGKNVRSAGFRPEIWGYVGDKSSFGKKKRLKDGFIRMTLAVLYSLPFGRKLKEILLRLFGQTRKLGDEMDPSCIPGITGKIHFEKLKSKGSDHLSEVLFIKAFK
jgi:SAM-dependent methyltransferase